MFLDFLAISATCACFLSMSDPVSLLTSYYVFGLFFRPRNGYVLDEPVLGGHITNLCEEGGHITNLYEESTS